MTQQEFELILTRLSIFEGFFKKFMNAKPEEFENLQRKAIEIGTQLGIPYSPVAEEEFKENTIYGDILITGKKTDADGNLQYNIAKVDENKSIIPSSRKMGVLHEELLEMVITQQSSDESSSNGTERVSLQS